MFAVIFRGLLAGKFVDLVNTLFISQIIDHPFIVDENSYKWYVSGDTTFGGEVEIQAFVEIYRIQVVVYHEASGISLSYGPEISNSKLNLLLSGDLDSGHYDVSKCINQNFWNDQKKNRNKLHYLANKNVLKARNAEKILNDRQLERKRMVNRVSNMNEKVVIRKGSQIVQNL